MPLFSVVIPAYEAEVFVSDALDSVARQTHTDYEVIVVDDGSQDGTADVVTGWIERNHGRKLTLHRQHNRGAGAARNAGIQLACGEFIAFLDSDDIWLERKLEKVASFLRQQPGVDLVCHDQWHVEEGRRKRLVRHGPHTRYEALLFKGNCVSPSATAVRRSALLAAGGFSEDVLFKIGEDYDLWLRLARAGFRFAYLHEPLGIYRIHSGGTTSKAGDYCRYYLNVLESHYRQWQHRSAYYRYLIRRRKAAVIRGSAYTLMKRGDHRQAQGFLNTALQADPFAWKTWVLTVLNVARVRV